MGQKVSPHGLRVGVIKDWDSKWYADKSKFADYLVEDNKVRDFVKKKLYVAGVSKIVLERAAENKLKVIVMTARPGMVIGRSGTGIEDLKSELEKIIDFTPDSKRLEKVRDIFLFCCFTGYDYSITAALTDKDLVADDDGALWIDTHRIKTKTAAKVKLLDIPLGIIKKYELRRDGNYLLPVMSNAKYNQYLKEIASACEIEKNVTSHLARHTFATFVKLFCNALLFKYLNNTTMNMGNDNGKEKAPDYAANYILSNNLC